MNSGLDERLHGGFLQRVRHGDPHHPTLLYLHGLGESGLCFEALMDHPVLAGWPQVAVDLHGYGKSERAAPALGLEAHARALAATLAPGRYVLIGHSMGGVVATFLAGLLDQRVAGFINIEGNISASDCTFSALIAACDPKEFAATGFARLCETVKRDGEYDRALALYAQSLRLAEPGQLYLNATELVAMSAAETLATAMGALTMPKTYLLGSPGGSGARTRELLALADVAWSAVPNAGHWPFIDQTDLCAAEIGGFLQRLEV